MKDTHAHPDDLTLGPVLYDLRGEQEDPHPGGRRRHGQTVRRDPAKVDAVVMHQAGVEFGARRDEQLYRRALGVTCHAMAFMDGSAVLAAPPLWYLNAAHRLNSRSVSLEVDGNYAGVRGHRIRQRGEMIEPTALTQLTIEAARLALRSLVAAAREDGCPIRYILAHRQSDSWRWRDPGPQLWLEVALACGVDELGLEALPELAVAHSKPKRHGLPIPAAWSEPAK